MQFKVGDRVEVLAPAEGVGNWDKNNIGYGTVERVSTDASGSVQIKVDANDCAWWYKLGKVRLVRPVNEPTPTPSITVGTQVRLTGVVTGPTRKIDGAIGVQVDAAPGEYRVVYVLESDLEAIRQPFKRGEVVYSKISATNEEPYVVLNDESLGMVDVTCCRTGFYIANDNPEAYERRP